MPAQSSQNGYIRLRSATPDDIDAIAAIYRHYVRTSTVTLEEQEPSTPTMLSRFESVNSSGYPYIVATTTLEPTQLSPSDDVVVGYAYASPFNDRTGYRFSVSTSVYLHADHTRQGLGMVLMRALMAQIKAKGFRQALAGISLSVEQPVTEVASCRLHGKLGFEVVARLKGVGEKFGRVVDVVWMQADMQGYEG